MTVPQKNISRHILSDKKQKNCKQSTPEKKQDILKALPAQTFMAVSFKPKKMEEMFRDNEPKMVKKKHFCEDKFIVLGKRQRQFASGWII